MYSPVQAYTSFVRNEKLVKYPRRRPGSRYLVRTRLENLPMDLRLLSIFSLLLFVVACSAAETDDDPDDGTSVQGWKLVWSDEFSRDGQPDPSKWSYDVGGHGWGNNELQYYAESRLKNARVENGNLIIEAHKESVQGSQYSSARLVTKGKGEWTYGRIEVRAKLPSGRGTWPAIWMLASQNSYGDGYWPDNGEIDIMEHVGFDPDVIHASVHTLAYNHTIGTQR